MCFAIERHYAAKSVAAAGKRASARVLVPRTVARMNIRR